MTDTEHKYTEELKARIVQLEADVARLTQERDIAATKAKNLGNDAKHMMGVLTQIEVCLGIVDDDYVDHVDAVRFVVAQRDEYKESLATERARTAEVEAGLAETREQLRRAAAAVEEYVDETNALKVENATLKAALPTEEERSAIAKAVIDRANGAEIVAAAWLSRLPASKENE